MKKSVVYLLSIIIILSSGFLTSVYAWPNIEVEGFVDPGIGINDNNGLTTTFSYVTYLFNVTNTNPSEDDNDSFMNFVSLEFEADVFANIGIVTSPGDWTYWLAVSGSGSKYVLGSAGTEGTVLGNGNQLKFVVENVSVYNAALVPGNKLWQEGPEQWGQSWMARDTLGGGDGGSTAFDDSVGPASEVPAPLVPEPVSAILFVTGGTLLAVKRYLRKEY